MPPRHPEQSEGSQDSSATPQNDIVLSTAAKAQALQMFDFLWMSHLENMEALSESVRLRAYGQQDPLVEYRREGHLLYQQMLADFDNWLTENVEKLKTNQSSASTGSATINLVPEQGRGTTDGQKTGRNDPCPCGSGKKYKKCHGA